MLAHFNLLFIGAYNHNARLGERGRHISISFSSELFEKVVFPVLQMRFQSPFHRSTACKTNINTSAKPISISFSSELKASYVLHTGLDKLFQSPFHRSTLGLPNIKASLTLISISFSSEHRKKIHI